MEIKNSKIKNSLLIFLILLVASSGAAVTETYSYTGSQQTFTVPDGVNQIDVTALGASGGELGFVNPGGKAEGTVSVNPGQTVYIYIGEKGSCSTSDVTGGDNSGGGAGGGDGVVNDEINSVEACSGGGSTDIRLGGTSLSDRVLVAGGGGGSASEENDPYEGGAGGGSQGGDGESSPIDASGGSGGDQTVESASGRDGSVVTSDSSSDAAGGGGGGYDGGEGGSADYTSGTSAAAGGGGSGYYDSSIVSNAVLTQGGGPDNGNGEVTISYTANSAPNSPSLSSPNDGATGVSTDNTLEVSVTDPDGDSMDVTFYDASDDSSIGTDSGVSDGGTASITWSNLNYGQQYSWYAVADDGSATTQSSTYSFTTTHLKKASNSNAPVGSAWIESAAIRWVSGGTEHIVKNGNIVNSDSPGPVGSVWIEGSSIHWIDTLGDERSYTGSVFDSATAAPNGYTWIENDLVHYVDQNGDERVIDGS